MNRFGDLEMVKTRLTQDWLPWFTTVRVKGCSQPIYDYTYFCFGAKMKLMTESTKSRIHYL